MAILDSPLGKFRQSIGNVTFGGWKGLNVAKQKAVQVANPKTAKQLKQRAAMSFMVNLSKQINSGLKVYWSKLAIKMSAYNAFVKENLSKLSYNTDHWEIPSSGFAMAKGSLKPLDVASITASV